MHTYKQKEAKKHPRACTAFDAVLKWTKELFFGGLAPDGDGVILCLWYFTHSNARTHTHTRHSTIAIRMCTLSMSNDWARRIQRSRASVVLVALFLSLALTLSSYIAHSLSPYWRTKKKQTKNIYSHFERTVCTQCGRIVVRVAHSVSIWIWPEEDVEFYASGYSFSQVHKQSHLKFIL